MGPARYAGQSDPSGKTLTSRKTPSIPPRKNIRLYRNSESQYQSAIPVQGEGRSSVVTYVDRGAVDAAASGTKARPGRDEPREVLSSVRTTGVNALRSPFRRSRTCPAKPLGKAGSLRTAKSCGPGRRCYGQALRRWFGAQPGLGPSSIRKATVTKRNSSPGRARHKPSTHCAGKAECSASPVCCCAVSLRYTFAQRTAGASRHPVFPAPSSRKRVKVEAKLGQLMPREGCFMRD